jgi:Fe-S cluster biosynthesis and repair protein YggX
MHAETIHCRRCGTDAPRLPHPPFRNELGERVAGEICADCWKDWLKHQTLLINHYGLDPREPQARAFLYEQIERVLLQGGDADQVDTSQQGTIEW